MTEEWLPKEAMVEVAITAGSALAGEVDPQRGAFATAVAAREAVERLAGAAAVAAAEAYGGSVRLQAMTGQVRGCVYCGCSRFNLSRSAI